MEAIGNISCSAAANASNFSCLNDTFLENTNQTVTNYYPKDYHTLLYQIIASILILTIAILGIVGNILVILVVVKVNHMRTPTNCYLVCMAAADLLDLLIIVVLGAIPGIFLPQNYWLYGDAGCKIMIYLQYLGINVSALSITAFTVERYIAICHPMKAHTMCTVSRAKKITIGLWLFAAIYCIPWLFIVKTYRLQYTDGTSFDYCYYSGDRREYLSYYFIDLVLFYILPAIITVILYGLISKVLFSGPILLRADREEESCQKRSDANVDAYKLKNKVTMCKPQNNEEIRALRNGSSMRRKASSNQARKQVVQMLAVVTIVFIVLWMPYRTLVVYNSIHKEGYYDQSFSFFSILCMYLNSAINPVLYSFMSAKFRRAFLVLLACRDRRKYLYEWTHVPTNGGDRHQVHHQIPLARANSNKTNASRLSSI